MGGFMTTEQLAESRRGEVKMFRDTAGDELEVHENGGGEVYLGAFEMVNGVHPEGCQHVGLSFDREKAIAIARWILEVTGGE